jgi:hypothetical protein
MKIFRYLIIIAFLSICSLSFSQKLKRPDKVTYADFVPSNFKSPTILCNLIQITFPFSPGNINAGALDRYFSLRIESFIRIVFNKDDSCKKLLILPKTFENGIKINSIEYYYKKNNKISTRKIKVTDIEIVTDNTGYNLDFSKILQDSSMILDINFSSNSKNKSIFTLCIDNNKIYKDFNAQIYIPEIYSYNSITSDSCILENGNTEFPGPIIGYRSLTGRFKILLPKDKADILTNKYNEEFEPVYLKINMVSIKMNKTCKGLFFSSDKGIIRLKRIRVAEIY